MSACRRLTLLLVAALAGCGQEAPPPAPVQQGHVVRGAVSKGPLQGATVNFFAVDVAGNLTGGSLATVTTDATGGFTVTGLPTTIPILVQTSFGSYIDESDPEPNPALRRRITFGSTDSLEAVLSPGQAVLAITPYSMAIYKKAFIQAAGSNFANTYAAVRAQATTAFGFDPMTTIPADPTTGEGGSRPYAILLGAAALTINQIAVTGSPEHLPGYADVIAFVDDFADGQLDAAPLEQMVSRFRNNNIGAYGNDDEVPSVNETALSQPAVVPNTAPSISAIADQSISEEGATGVLSFTIGDAEDAATALVVTRASTNTTLAPLANIVLGGTGATRSVTVTPVANGFGTSTITVTVTDTDGAAASDSFLLTVNNVNDAPIINSTASTTATEDVAYTYNATVNDSDGPAPAWSLGASHTCGGSIGATSGVFTFTPAGPVPAASCVLEVQVSDGGAPVTQTTTVNITPVNDLPVINSTAPTTATEDTLYTYNATRLDPDGPGTTWALSPGNTCAGASIVPATGVYTFTPAGPAPPASCVVGVQVSDGGTPVVQNTTITIAAVNDAPVINSTASTTAAEDSLYTYNATVNDSDGPAPNWSLGGLHTCGGSIGASSGVFTFTPAGPVPVASCVVEVQVSDGGAPVTQSTTVNITAVNDLPVINSTAPTTATEDTLYTYNATVTDADGPAPTWSLSGAHTCGGSIVPGTGVLTFTPAGPAPPASCVVGVQVTDGGTPVTQSTTVTITAMNDAPTISDVPDSSILEDTDTGSIAYTIGDGETPAASLGFAGTSGNQALVPNANVIEGGGGASRNVTVTPVVNGYGSALITMTVTDAGSATAVDTFTLTVDPVSDAPSSQTFGVQTDQDLDYVFGTAEFNFSDAGDAAGDGTDEDSFDAVVINSLPVEGVLILNDGAIDQPITVLPAPLISTSDITLGRFKFRPDPGESGIPYASFTFQVQDTGSAANGGVIASIAYALSVDVMPVAGGTEHLLPYLTATGELMLFDPSDPANPFLVASGLPTAGFLSETLLAASGTGNTATGIHAARLVYIHDDGVGSRTVWKVALEAAASHTPVRLSNIADACDFNGVAEDIRNPDNSILRVDTAGADGVCGSVDDFATAEAYLVTLTTPAASPGTQIGLGGCCGIAGITDTDGNLIGVLTSEDDGTGSTFFLKRYDVFDLVNAIFQQSLDIAGNGQIYGRIVRGHGNQHIYVRALRTSVDTTYKLLRFNVATNNLTALFDYGISDASAFVDDLDSATYDATNLYFTSADTVALLRVPHAATSPADVVPLANGGPGDNILTIEQTASRIVYQVAGSAGGVRSILKTGGAAVILAPDSFTPPLAANFLEFTDSGRVYVSTLHAGETPEHTAAVIADDGSVSPPPIPDAQWVGENFQTTCDFGSNCEDTIAAQHIFLRHGAASANADIEIVDPATGAPTGDFFQQIVNVQSGPAVFGFGFGRYAQFTFISLVPNSDVWLGDTQAAGPGGPAGSLQVASADASGDDRWLLFGDDDQGTGPAPTCTSPPAGLVAWYPGDGNFNDIQGGNHGIQQGAQFGPGQIDQAFTFDGIDDRVEVPNGLPAPTPSGITLDAWVKFNSTAGDQMIVTRDLSGVGEAYVLFHGGANTLQADAQDPSGADSSLTSSFVPTPGTWYHVVYTFDDGIDTQQLYVNGSLIGSNTNTSPVQYDLSPMTIGADVEPGPTTISFFDGLIDEVEMFDRALSQPEIQAIFDAGSAGKCKPIAASDADADGLTHAQEMTAGTNPNSSDTDSDGFSDGQELAHGGNPGVFDPATDTDPRNPDSDGDGAGDGLEVAMGSNPRAVNTVIRVSGQFGNDSNTGANWTDSPPGTGPLQTNAGAVARLDALGPYPPDAINTFFALYDGTNSTTPLAPGPLDLTGITARQFITFVGSVGPTTFVPQYPPTTTFDAMGGGRAVNVENALSIVLRNVEITGGNVVSPNMGGGVFLHDANGVADLTLRNVLVTGNTAERGGGLAALNDSQTLRVFDSVVESNSALSTTFGAGGGIYADDARLELVNSTVRNNTASGGTGFAQGGGVWIAQSFSDIQDSVIEGNSAFSGSAPGGGGGGVYVAPGGSSTNVAVTGSKLIGNSATGGPSSPDHGGGGLNAAGNTFVAVEDSLIAANTTNNGPGGGINLINGAATVRDNQILSNQSNRPGAGLHVHVNAGAGGPFDVLNNLIMGNVSTDADAEGAGIEIEHNTLAPLRVDSNTVAYNQVLNNTATGLGSGVAIFPSTAPGYELKNNIVWFNDNATVNNPFAPEPGDNLFAQAPFSPAPAGNNANETAAPGNAAGMPADPDFVQGFYLRPGVSTSVNAGDDTAFGAANLVIAPFTTHPSGGNDAAPVDIGFHHTVGSSGSFDSVAGSVPSVCADVPRDIIFTPAFAGAPTGKPGHLIVVEISGTSSTLSSLTTLDPRANGSRIARDLGDGRYLVRVSVPAAAESATFTVFADDSPTPRTFIVLLDRACS